MVKKDNKKKKSSLVSKIIIWTMVFLMTFSAFASLLGIIMQ
ncbi:hypothetical protein [Marinilactibacillus kalidii]|nr:hypothetical protein [Marinilactibacillus kalidii]